MKSEIIDLSMLTVAEIKQIDDNKTVLTDGDKDCAVYMRYSSDRQTEQSIEGQLRDIITHCIQKGYRIRDVYVDRATSANKEVEKRLSFQKMIKDSVKHRWSYVLVWKLDRFARNRNDSTTYKIKLKQNGVKVVSVTENISETPEGIILESVLEGLAEYYSAELSQKITRGLRESALKCRSIGASVPLGYKIENHHYVIDPLTAPIVKEAFELYAQGTSAAEIKRIFEEKGYRSSKGAHFNKSSFKTILSNQKYIGNYIYKDMVIEGGMPAIVDRELFDKVQNRLKEVAKAPAREKAHVDYLLSGKAFCGHCGNTLVGDCGTSKTGAVHYYYTCLSRKSRGNCRKKSIRKDLLEDCIAKDTLELFTAEFIEKLADVAVSQSEAEVLQNTRLPELQKKLSDQKKTISNIISAIEKGVASDTLINRLSELEKEKKETELAIAEEGKDVIVLDKYQVIYWLEKFKDGDIHDDKFKRLLFDLLINRVTVWDVPDGFKVTITYNLTSQTPRTVQVPKSSDLSSQRPLLDAYPNSYVAGFWFVHTKIHSLR